MQEIAERVDLSMECQECGYSPSKGDLIVNRARFGRLLAVVAAAHALAHVAIWDYHDAAYGDAERALDAALDALQVGDRDPPP